MKVKIIKHSYIILNLLPCKEKVKLKNYRLSAINYIKYSIIILHNYNNIEETVFMVFSVYIGLYLNAEVVIR